jgi:hypothetical protein
MHPSYDVVNRLLDASRHLRQPSWMHVCGNRFRDVHWKCPCTLEPSIWYDVCSSSIIFWFIQLSSAGHPEFVPDIAQLFS